MKSFLLTTAALALLTGGGFGPGAVRGRRLRSHPIRSCYRADRTRAADFHQHGDAGEQCHRRLQPGVSNVTRTAESLRTLPIAFDLLDVVGSSRQHLRQFSTGDGYGQHRHERAIFLPVRQRSANRNCSRLRYPQHFGSAADRRARSDHRPKRCDHREQSPDSRDDASQ